MNNRTFITVTATDNNRGRRVMLPIDRIILIREKTDIHEREKGINTIIQSEDNGYITARETFNYIAKEIEALNELNDRNGRNKRGEN